MLELPKDSPFYHADAIKEQPITLKSSAYNYTHRDIYLVRTLEKHKAMTGYVLANLFWPRGSTGYKDRLKYLSQTGFITRYELYYQDKPALTVYGTGPTAKKFIPDLEYEPLRDPLSALRIAAANRFYLVLKQSRNVPEFTVNGGYITARFSFTFVNSELKYALMIPRPADNTMQLIQTLKNLPPSDSRVIVLASSRQHAEILAGEFAKANVVVPIRYTWDRLMAEAPLEELFWTYENEEFKKV